MEAPSISAKHYKSYDMIGNDGHDGYKFEANTANTFTANNFFVSNVQQQLSTIIGVTFQNLFGGGGPAAYPRLHGYWGNQARTRGSWELGSKVPPTKNGKVCGFGSLFFGSGQILCTK